MIRPNSANRRSQQIPNPNLQQGVSNTQILFPLQKVSDSLQVILPGISMSNKWILSMVVWTFPSGLITKAVLKNLLVSPWLYFLGIEPIAYIFFWAQISLIAERVGESLKSSANLIIQSLVQGELQTSPKMDTLVPLSPAVQRASWRYLMLASLFVTHLVWRRAILNFCRPCILYLKIF